MRGGVLHRGLGPLPVPTDLDWQPSLQAQLDAAIAAGKKVFTLPAGVSYYGSSIVIPKGTSDLTIQGAPDGSTVLKALNAFADDIGLLEIGRENNDVNDIWDAGGVHSALEPCARGDYLVKLVGEEELPLEPGNWYALGDQATIPFLDDNDEWQDITYRAELTQCVAWDANSLTATLASPLERNYDTSPTALHLQFDLANRICQNITLKDFAIDGKYGDDDSDRNWNGIWCAFNINLTVQGVTAVDFINDHMRSDVSRNIRMQSVNLANTAEVVVTQLEPADRGISFFQCVDIEVRDTSATQLNHGILFGAANSNFLVDGYVATESVDASLDCHGEHNHYGVLRNFNVDDRCKIGNISFPAGDQNIRVENGVCDKALEVQGGSGDLVVSNLQAKYMLLSTIRGRQDDYPHDCTYISCSFVMPDGGPSDANLSCNMGQGNGIGEAFKRFTNQRFELCSFVQGIEPPDATWNLFFESLGVLGATGIVSDATFVKCRFTNHSAQELVTNEAQVEDTDFELTFDGCIFDSVVGADWPFAIAFDEDSQGSCTISHSTFYTDGENPAWADNQAGSEMVVDHTNDNHIHTH